MEWWTVILLVPPASAVAYGEFYLAHLRAKDRDYAVQMARVDACDQYDMPASRAEEWPCIVCIKGKHRDYNAQSPITVNSKRIQPLLIAH